jgi:hypothetical protein
MITPNHRHEALSWTYVEAVAAQCGVTCSYPQLDYGIDLTLVHVERKDRVLSESGYKFDVQIKSTRSDADLAAGFVYDLDVRAYEALRVAGVGNPRLLVLVVLPTDDRAWVVAGPEGLTLRRGAFWLSIAGAPAVRNRRSVRLVIPAGNTFTPAGLARLFRRQMNQEPL